ncbi:unnamed protein product [Adineta steineri]|uniref:Uncharacterized protein n=1 Tax=Adineta steineri TaxID=433720 RepID=A0A818RJ79_9BILA|nr:unnamed protein product [Adineta steineri]
MHSSAVEIKQEPLSLPASSSLSPLIPNTLSTNDSKVTTSINNPFVSMTIVQNIQYYNQSNIKAEAKESPTIVTIFSDNKPQIHVLNQYALQQKEQEFRIRKER